MSCREGRGDFLQKYLTTLVLVAAKHVLCAIKRTNDLTPFSSIILTLFGGGGGGGGGGRKVPVPISTFENFLDI